MKSNIENKLMNEPNISLAQDLVKLVAEIDEFKGRWEALTNLSPGSPECPAKNSNNSKRWFFY